MGCSTGGCPPDADRHPGRSAEYDPRAALHPPANVFRAAIEPAEDYSFNGFNASVQVYQFRRFNGDIRQAFQATLLRDWIAPMHKEENVGSQPTFQPFLPGGNIGLFDFAAAERRDPPNVGSYTVDGGKLVIQMENSTRETIVTEVPQGGVLGIYAVAYRRQ
jgi:hypothetical protein